MTGKVRTKRFKTCLGCPFGTGSACELKREPHPVFTGTRPKPLGQKPHNPPPRWCPLRRRNVLLVLETEGT